MPVGHFLAGIGALIFDPMSEKYLLLKRSAQKDVGAGDWECPTGRVDQGESFEDALHREVQEELGCRIQVQFLVGTTHFYRGDELPENELVGLIYAGILEDPDAVRIGEEHSEYRWLSGPEVEEFLPKRHWLHWVIRRTESMRRMIAPELQGVFLDEGFEVGGSVR